MNAVVVVALFILLTPGLVVKFPSKNIYVVALVHAVVFAIAYALLNHFWTSYEGFESDIRPTCPKDTTFNMDISACCNTVYTDQEDDTPKGSGQCPAGKKWWGATKRCAIKRYTNISPGFCPKDYTQLANNWCRPTPRPTVPVEPTCRYGVFDPEDCSCGDNSLPTCPKMYTLGNFSIGDNDFGCWCLPDAEPISVSLDGSTGPSSEPSTGPLSESQTPESMSLQVGGDDLGYMCYKS
jgi:hypothetical protein